MNGRDELIGIRLGLPNFFCSHSACAAERPLGGWPQTYRYCAWCHKALRSEHVPISVPNARAFYNHLDHSVEKATQELELEILQGPFTGLPFLPCQTIEQSYVIQKGKKRRIGRADAPYNFLWDGQDCSLNANIDLDELPMMHLPSLFAFTANVAIAQTLYDATEDPRHIQALDGLPEYQCTIADSQSETTSLRSMQPE
jgi:hypothetical protein